MKRVIISGGGTGGHIFPALSIANALKRLDPNVDILFVGAEGKMEMEKVPEAGFRIIGLPVRGFQRRLTLENVKVLLNLWKSLRRAKQIIRDFKPNVVVGVGGYASGPIGREAVKSGVVRVCVAYEGMERFFGSDKVIFTGNPVRKDLLLSKNKREEGLAFYGLNVKKRTVLVTGGSLGARTLNQAMKKNIEKFSNLQNVQILWQCGSYYYEDLQRELKGKLPENICLTAFLKRMDLAYACADVVVARAGAGTISELCLLGKAAILVPSPNVAEDHQTKNAMALVEKGAAIMLKDAEAEEKFGDTLEHLLCDEGKLASLRASIGTLAVRDSDEKIAREILSLIKTE